MDMKYLGVYETYQDQHALNVWRNNTVCNYINGTDGTRFHPMTPHDKLSVFAPLFCRLFDFVAKQSKSILSEKENSDVLYDQLKQIPFIRFLFDEDNLLNKQINECLCLENDTSLCPAKGLFNLRKCPFANNKELIASLPYFNNDANLLKQTNLKCKDFSFDKYGSFLDVDQVGILLSK